MTNSLKYQAFGWLVLSSVILAGPSAFADERDQWRTGRTDESIEVRPEEREQSRGRRVVEGSVDQVNRSGNRFEIRTARGRITVLVPENIPILASGRTLRARDLREGDNVRVTYDRASRGEVRATRIQVITELSQERQPRATDDQAVRPRPSSDDQELRRRRRMEADEQARRDRERELRSDRGTRGRYDREERGMVQGTVVSVNERLDTFDVRLDDGREIRVDAYPLRSRGGFSLRNIRSGTRVSLQGEWMEDGAFRVDRVSGAGESQELRRMNTTSRRQIIDEDDDDEDDDRDEDRDRDDDEDEDEDDDPRPR